MSKIIGAPIVVRLDRFRGGGHRFDAVVSESREDKALKAMVVIDSVKALLPPLPLVSEDECSLDSIRTVGTLDQSVCSRRYLPVEVFQNSGQSVEVAKEEEVMRAQPDYCYQKLKIED
jgi:hypothetical protein